MKKIIVTGASGMIGGLILEQSLSSDRVSEVISLVRRPSDISHPKLREVVIDNFTDFSSNIDLFQNVEMAFFCIGAYTGQVSSEVFREITVDIPVSFCTTLLNQSPNASISFLSGAGADRTEKSRIDFAKFKGIAENKLEALGSSKIYYFRPGYIYPVTPRKEPNFTYKISRFLYPIIKMFGSNMSIKSTELADAMFKAALLGSEKNILENKDILQLIK